jgi:hypothetical protein
MELTRNTAVLIVAAFVAMPMCAAQREAKPPETTSPAHSSSVPQKTSLSERERTSRFLQMPLDFELNRGEAPKDFQFVAHGPSYSLGISSSGVALSLHRPAPDKSAANDPSLAAPVAVESSTLRLKLLGALDSSVVTGLDAQPGRSNYFIGNDPAKWRVDIPHFNRVKVAEAYPGIDVVFYGNRQQLEYDFAVAPGADASRIRLQADGAELVKIDPTGNAILETAAGDVELKHPVAYQEFDGVRHPVESAFQIAKGGELHIALGNYDHAHALVIDPILEFSVAIGGSNGNQGIGLTVDSSGDVYVTGNTCSADFPTTSGPFQNIDTNPAAINCQDAFVVKLDPAGATLLYSDFIGGAGGSSTGAHVAVDSTGNLYVAGATGATDFPRVSNIGPSALAPCSINKPGYNCAQGFILKLSPDGTQILFSSLLGGSQSSGAFQVKLNPVTNDLVVLGVTDSSNFMPAPTTLETTFGGGTCTNSVPCFNSFILGLNPATGALRYGTFLGGTGNTWSAGLAFDSSGNIYVAGSTQPPLSNTLGAVTNTYPPAGGATAAGTSLFILKLNLSGTTLTPGYLTLVGADADTMAVTLAVDASSNAYFGGATAGVHLPVTAGAYQTTNNDPGENNCLWGVGVTPFLPSACGTGLVGKLSSSGALSFLTYLGGNSQDEVMALGLDSTNNIWLTGVTSSQDFPVSSDQYLGSWGFDTPFLAEMSNDGTMLPFATFAGGSFGESSDIYVDASNNIYITGFPAGNDITPGVYPSNPDAYIPLFVEKWGEGPAPSISVSATYLSFGTVALGGSAPPQMATVQNNGTVPMQLSVQLQAQYPGETPSDFPESTTCGTSLAAGASCTVTASFAPGPPSQICVQEPGCDTSSRTANILISNNASQGTQNLALLGASAVGPSFSFAPDPIVFPAQAAGTSSAQLFAQAESAGDSQLTITNIAITGPNASDFQLTLTGDGPPCMPNAVPPGSFCDLGITFSPPANATGTRTASLVFTDLAGDSPQSIPITGTVAAANFLNISPLTLSPTFPVAFGNSTTAVLDLQNPSTTNSVQVTGLNIAGTNAGDFAVAPGDCGNNGVLPMTIPANTTCYVFMTFTPAAGASGQRVATLTVVTTPAATGLPTVALSGDVVTNSQPDMSLIEVPNPLNFGGLQVGETSNSLSVLLTLYNNYPIPCAGGASFCGAPLVISNIVPGLSDYTLVAVSNSNCLPFPATIIIGGNCTYGLVFTPTQAGPRNTTLTITSNDPQGPIQVPVYGTGLSLPLGEALQTALDFGNSAIGVASPPLSTTLLNAGMANLVISGVTVTSNFTITANTCTGSLAPQATCMITVTFTPPSAGNFSGTLTISDNDPFGPQQVVTMAGTGATGPQLRIMPPTLNFGNQQVNVASPAQTITFTSTGDTAITFPASAIRTSADFILQSTTCGVTLPFGASCTASVQYKPVEVTGISEFGTLLITDSASGSPQPVYMQGTATVGAGIISTTTLTSSLNPSTSGQSVTFTATVTGPSGNTTVPTGTVTFNDGFAPIGMSNLNASGQATFATSALSVANHNISASYSGDSNFAASTSGSLIQTVIAGTTTTPSLTVTPTPASITTTQALSVTVTVSGTPTPTGSVVLTSGSYTSGAITLSGGIATVSIPAGALAAGTDTLTATYSPDSNSSSIYNSATGSGTVTVTQATDTLTITGPLQIGSNYTDFGTGPNGPYTPAPGYGTFTVTQATGVYQSDGIAVGATGSIQSLNEGTGPVTLPGAFLTFNGAASGIQFVATSLPAGATAGPFTLTQNGTSVDATFQVIGTLVNTSTNAQVENLTLTFVTIFPNTTVSALFTTLPLDGIYNAPAASATTPTLTVTPSTTSITTTQALSVTVTVGGTPTPTGSVTLTSGTYTSGAVTLSAGSATINIPAGTLAKGTDTLTATYTPDSNSSSTYNSATGSNTVTVTSPALITPTVAVTPGSSSITSAQTLSVTVTVGGGSGNPTPTGSVTLTSGTYSSGPVTLSSGSATITIPAGSLATATDTLTATYTPDSNSSTTYNSATGSNTVTVTAATVQVTVGTTPAGLSFSVDGTSYSSAQTFTWTVGASHTIATTTPQILVGTQESFFAWSDGGAQSHTVTASSTTTTYTATFTATAYQLTTAASPAADGSVTPASGTFYATGTVVNLTATPNSGFSFVNWTGSVASANSASTTVTMSAPEAVTANFGAAVVTAPAAALTPATLTFSGVSGATSAAQSVTLSNSGNATLNITGITITGTNPTDFAISTGTNACGATLAAGANCSIYVTFTPASAASFSATLSVADNASGSPQTTGLSGTGTPPPTFTISSSTGPQTIQPGGTAQFTIIATAQNGTFSNAVALTTSGLPAGAIGTFSPASITPGSSSASSTLSIQTGSTATAAVTGHNSGHNSTWPFATSLALIGLCLLPGKRRRRWITMALLLIASLGAFTVLTSCGGGFGLTAPPQSYTITVTGTSGTEVQTTTVQLTVE